MAQADLIDIRKCKGEADRSVLKAFAVSVEFQPDIAAWFLHTIQIRIEHFLCYILFTCEPVRPAPVAFVSIGQAYIYLIFEPLTKNPRNNNTDAANILESLLILMRAIKSQQKSRQPLSIRKKTWMVPEHRPMDTSRRAKMDLNASNFAIGPFTLFLKTATETGYCPSGNTTSNPTPREVSARKGGIFRSGQEIEGLRGGVHGYRLAGGRVGCRDQRSSPPKPLRPPPKAAANPAAALPPHGGLGAQSGNFRLHYSSGITMLCFSVSRRNNSIGEDLIFESCSTIFIPDRELFEGGRT